MKMILTITRRMNLNKHEMNFLKFTISSMVTCKYYWLKPLVFVKKIPVYLFW
jgi:hypothetical protein